MSLQQDIDRPLDIEATVDRVTTNNLNTRSEKLAAVTISWTEVQNADTYEIDTSSAYNETWRQPVGEHQVLGTGDTMGVSVSLLQNVLVGYEYQVRVRAVDCLQRFGDWAQKKMLVGEDRVLFV